jgi:hypothetical protein
MIHNPNSSKYRINGILDYDDMHQIKDWMCILSIWNSNIKDKNVQVLVQKIQNIVR